jgi:hypothetical protein
MCLNRSQRSQLPFINIPFHYVFLCKNSFQNTHFKGVGKLHNKIADFCQHKCSLMLFIRGSPLITAANMMKEKYVSAMSDGPLLWHRYVLGSHMKTYGG